jgi:hypothetical protein
VAGCCECGDEPSGSCATELVNTLICVTFNQGTYSLQKICLCGSNYDLNSKSGLVSTLSILAGASRSCKIIIEHIIAFGGWGIVFCVRFII